MRRMVVNLNLPIEIGTVSRRREADRLAMSNWTGHLIEQERFVGCRGPFTSRSCGSRRRFERLGRLGFSAALKEPSRRVRLDWVGSPDLEVWVENWRLARRLVQRSESHHTRPYLDGRQWAEFAGAIQSLSNTPFDGVAPMPITGSAVAAGSGFERYSSGVTSRCYRHAAILERSNAYS
uniref:Hypothetical 20.2 kDa protein n=1 Tax=Bradyrhizobium sp. (strain WM9) TaxID=133505 RepID=Q9APZ6_BRASW|nr:hypothetical 20.2 kDa protein [Bradyrhizobium sp. WM9]